MKKIQHIASASMIALALSATAFAGDITVNRNRSGDITVNKTTSVAGETSVGKSGDITVGLVGILETLFSIIIP